MLTFGERVCGLVLVLIFNRAGERSTVEIRPLHVFDSWSLLDTWVLNNGTALVLNRVDGLEIHDFYVFSRFAGMLLTDSPDTTQNPPCAAGLGSDIDIENVQYGIIAIASRLYAFTSLTVGAAPGLGQAAVQLRSGAPNGCAPQLSINGGAARGSWAFGAFPTPQAGNLHLANIQ
jgi:hypothetical protein